MRCPHCGQALVRRPSHQEIIRHGFRLTLTGIPAWCCPACGHALLSDWQSSALEQLLDRIAITLQELQREHRA